MENVHFDLMGTVINNLNMEILEHGYLVDDGKWKHYNINSPFNRLYFIEEGFAYVENSSHRVDLHPGNIYLIPLHTTYNYINDDYFKKFYLHFRAELFAGIDIFEDIEAPLQLPFPASSLPEVVRKCESNNLADIMYCKGLFLQIISSFIETFSDRLYEKYRLTAKYQKLYKYLKENCSADITTSSLALSMNTTVSGLCKSFKKDIGTTLKSHIDKHLVQKAKERLLLTDNSIKEISYELRFSDEFYFSRYFKKYTGLSPREYRLKNKINS